MGSAEDNTDNNAPMAFVLSLAAGMATCLGAAVVFNTRLVKLASKRFLAGSLGIAAGVMLYVSFVEMLEESVEAFSNYGYAEADAYLYGTLSFFGGILFYKCIDYVVHFLEGNASHHDIDIELYDLEQSSPDNGTSAGRNNFRGGVVSDPSASSDVLKGGKVQPIQQQEHDQKSLDLAEPEKVSTAGGVQSAIEEEKRGGEGAGHDGAEAAVETTVQADVPDEKLVRMGLMTALAIGIHNFPEGVATFVATLSDPVVGAALAVAIAIHNIPEGLCVAIPVYYATGNRWKAFGWAFLSGISEPIGAGLAWLILKDTMTEMVYGILFGVVAGMMVIISLQELIPTAVRYDPTDSVTTNSIIAGMIIMALSLILFLY